MTDWYPVGTVGILYYAGVRRGLVVVAPQRGFTLRRAGLVLGWVTVG